MSELLQLNNVTKSFGAVEALVNVSFSVNSGEVVALLGDNGAGKSTLIKILSGVHKHDNGKIKWQGNDIVIKSPAHARQIGFSVVYQDLAVVPLISIYRNFFLGKEELICKKILGVSFIRNNYAKNIARNALKQLGIEIENSNYFDLSYTLKNLYKYQNNLSNEEINFIDRNINENFEF